jgi:1-pyrroline-5-carboxylate dehydrogenase
MPECGGKNYHWLHNSAEVNNAVYATIRSAFEFQVRSHSNVGRSVSMAATAVKA